MIEEQTVKQFIRILYDDIIQYYKVRYNAMRHDIEKCNAIVHDMIRYDTIYRYKNCDENCFNHSNMIRYNTIA